MNKKLITTLVACTLAVTSSLAYYAYTLHTYVNKLELLNELKQESIDLSEEIMSIQSVDIDNYKITISGLQELIEDVQAENEKYITQIAELSNKLDKITAQTYFNSSDVTQASNATVTHMKRALEGTELSQLSSAYIEAEKTYGVNAYFIAAITCLESSWGTSNRAVNDNNLTGFAVYNNLAAGRKFSSKEECIMETAKLLKQDYLTVGGKCYNGLSAKDVNSKYCFLLDGSEPDYSWHQKVTSIAISLKNKANII